jgi:ubiquitin-protein ligase
MLSEPNFESPANIDASVELRNDPKAYRGRIRKLVRESQDAL